MGEESQTSRKGSVYPQKSGRFAGCLKTASGKKIYFYGKTKKEIVEKLRERQKENGQG